jgi:hypothetical protein
MSWFFILLTALLVNLGGQAQAGYDAEQSSMPDQLSSTCWYCIPCKKKFFDLGSLNKHIKKHHHVSSKNCGVVEKYTAPSYICYECRYAFSSHRLLGEHNRRVHPQRPRR